MKRPLERILYIELKSGYSDDGPAWIGIVKYSKSGQTIYFNNKGFQQSADISSNYKDIETGERYWISGVKKNGEDRHWAGSGKIMIDRDIVDEYLQITGQKSIDTKRFELVSIEHEYPIDRINKILNKL
ncbi:MAG: mannose-1-phosphate guanylyltransferase [Firmicutes bacterium HGW-Firmicutes-1]|jgi:hypothetical protein|nr:MAG: mannose-1-phosphate guanylyltransferase [Firmicutes bacterium HGW-Firmicutes-1]